MNNTLSHYNNMSYSQLKRYVAENPNNNAEALAVLNEKDESLGRKLKKVSALESVEQTEKRLKKTYKRYTNWLNSLGPNLSYREEKLRLEYGLFCEDYEEALAAKTSGNDKKWNKYLKEQNEKKNSDIKEKNVKVVDSIAKKGKVTSEDVISYVDAHSSSMDDYLQRTLKNSLVSRIDAYTIGSQANSNSNAQQTQQDQVISALEQNQVRILKREKNSRLWGAGIGAVVTGLAASGVLGISGIGLAPYVLTALAAGYTIKQVVGAFSANREIKGLTQSAAVSSGRRR